MVNRTATMVIGLTVFVAVGVILLGPAAGVVNDHTGTQTVTNETVTAAQNQSVDLQGYNVASGSVTVYGLNDTSGKYEVATSPEDYSVHRGPGTVSFNSSSSLIQSGESVKVSYQYQATDGVTSLVLGFLPLGLGLVIFTVVASKVQEVM